MNAHKHMELIFAAVVVAGCVVAALPDDLGRQARPEAAPPEMAVVVVKAKRMTALEKRASVGADAAVRPATSGG